MGMCMAARPSISWPRLALALVCALVLPGTWFIVAASMGAATIGAVMYR